MIYRVFTATDTFVTNYFNPDALIPPATGSNFGSSEVLELLKLDGVTSGSGYTVSASYGHILINFDLTTLSALTASKEIPSSGLNYHLVLKDARHTGTLPAAFSAEVLRVSQPWSAGNGADVDFFTDHGVANWIYAQQNVPWTTPGASGTMPIPVFFATGHENLDADVTPIVNAWLTGGLTNNGFLVRISSSLESTSGSYFVKKFHSSDTFFDDWRPYLEVRWDDSVKDDRNNFVFDNTSTLFLYNRVRGQYADLPGVPATLPINIHDLSGTIMGVTASYFGLPGIYSASFVLPTGSYSGSQFFDIWLSGSRALMTGTFSPLDSFAQPVVHPNTYQMGVTNLQNQYRPYELVRINVFTKTRDYNPPVIQGTGSSDTGVNGLVLTKAYWQIENDLTGEAVVPFGTGSVETTRMSYDQRGNWFRIYMSSLSPGNIYRIVFLAVVDGESRVIDQGFKFRIANQ